MKKTGYVCLICMFLITFVLWLFLMEPFAQVNPKARNIAFVYTDASLFQYQLAQGAKTAADDYPNSTLTQFNLIGGDWQSQFKMIQNGGFAGVLLGCGNENQRAYELCQQLGIPSVQLCESQDGPSVLKDDFLLGQEMLKCVENMNLPGVVVLKDCDPLTDERMKGFQSMMDAALPCIVVDEAEQGNWYLSDEAQDAVCRGAGIVALGEQSTAWVLQEMEMGKIPMQAPLLGLNSDYDIAALEDGRVQTLFYARPYIIGFRGFELMCAGLNGGFHADSVIRVPYLKVTLDNLYEDQYIKTIFPLLE